MHLLSNQQQMQPVLYLYSPFTPDSQNLQLQLASGAGLSTLIMCTVLGGTLPHINSAASQEVVL